MGGRNRDYEGQFSVRKGFASHGEEELVLEDGMVKSIGREREGMCVGRIVNLMEDGDLVESIFIPWFVQDGEE